MENVFHFSKELDGVTHSMVVILFPRTVLILQIITVLPDNVFALNVKVGVSNPKLVFKFQNAALLLTVVETARLFLKGLAGVRLPIPATTFLLSVLITIIAKQVGVLVIQGLVGAPSKNHVSRFQLAVQSLITVVVVSHLYQVLLGAQSQINATPFLPIVRNPRLIIAKLVNAFALLDKVGVQINMLVLIFLRAAIHTITVGLA